MATPIDSVRAVINCNGIEIRLTGDTGRFAASLTCEPIQDGVFDIMLRLKAQAQAQRPDVVLAWDLPHVDLHHKWNSECMQNRALVVGNATANFVTGRANRQAPV